MSEDQATSTETATETVATAEPTATATITREERIAKLSAESAEATTEAKTSEEPKQEQPAKPEPTEEEKIKAEAQRIADVTAANRALRSEAKRIETEKKALESRKAELESHATFRARLDEAKSKGDVLSAVQAIFGEEVGAEKLIDLIISHSDEPKALTAEDAEAIAQKKWEAFRAKEREEAEAKAKTETQEKFDTGANAYLQSINEVFQARKSEFQNVETIGLTRADVLELAQKHFKATGAIPDPDLLLEAADDMLAARRRLAEGKRRERPQAAKPAAPPMPPMNDAGGLVEKPDDRPVTYQAKRQAMIAKLSRGG